jgi:hypothetical protein
VCSATPSSLRGHTLATIGREYDVWRVIATASRSASNRSLYVSRVTFADLCPSIRWRDSTLTPALTARLAHVCRRSWGVMLWTFARLTAAANHPSDDFGRGRYLPSRPGNTKASAVLPPHRCDSSSRTKAGTGTDRAVRPLVRPTAWSTPSWTAFSDTMSRRRRNSTSRTLSAMASPPQPSGNSTALEETSKTYSQLAIH